jgi:8-oxo-dGTP pyrophosphatase MutT (NUDIX family)
MKTQKILPWKTLSSKITYKTPWCSVKEDTVQLPNGTIINDYNVVQLRDVAMVFALTKDKKVPFVRQYRYGVNKVLLELPAGTYIKDKEGPEEAAKRELWEETGYKAENFIKLGEVYDYPTKDSHSITIYFAENLSYVTPDYKEVSEDIEIVTLPLEEIDDYIKNGEISVA